LKHLLFVNKKKQKNFYTLGLGHTRTHGHSVVKKSFCFFFFSKEVPAALPQPRMHVMQDRRAGVQRNNIACLTVDPSAI
jgi:hypothetical protein